MKVNVSTATTSQLDWLVAKCEGLDTWMRHEWLNYLAALPDAVPDSLEWLLTVQPNEPIYVVNRITHFLPQYSTDWSQGGPIIGRERIETNTAPKALWSANGSVFGCMEYGPTPLIAVMRCYVAKELGQEVDIPQELT